ncbi:siphovirus Gp157 family protein [Phormidium sp. LEGE 05292]|uniref:siphovirus Gp157 family protein n=1 Tax=[Phormidium] sp. LEGE 05292 TaxID=767427 RepID=UPI0018822B5C|nr:siphovirus Gp157 family protein [Phormidium sp. LEGE 05292]MBE9228510.1 siphovirus Gp157 family protein [Phormidium sp. LEGE 05292]
MNLATQSLAQTSMIAAQLWQQLELTQTPEEIDQLLQSIWHNQENQELCIDAQAELADQIDAELAAIKARMQFLIDLHQAAINKLEGWRQRLDHTIIYFNQKGLLTSEMIGKQRRITVTENPPTCEVLVDPSQLPESYCRVETKTIISPDKKAIANAWKQGIPVDGTRIYRKRKVIYSFLPSSLPQYQANQVEPSKSKRQKRGSTN